MRHHRLQSALEKLAVSLLRNDTSMQGLYNATTLLQNLHVHELQRSKRKLAQLVQMTIVRTRRRILEDKFTLYGTNMKQRECCGCLKFERKAVHSAPQIGEGRTGP